MLEVMIVFGLWLCFFMFGNLMNFFVFFFVIVKLIFKLYLEGF